MASADASSRPLSRAAIAPLKTGGHIVGGPSVAMYIILTIAQALPTAFVYTMLSKDVQLTAAEIATFYHATFIPWTIKPVYALVSDQLPLCGRRRTPYFMLACALAALSSIVMATATQRDVVVVSAVCVALFGSFAQVMVDGGVIDRTHRYQADAPLLPTMDSAPSQWSVLPQDDSSTSVDSDTYHTNRQQSISAASAQAAAHISRSLGGLMASLASSYIFQDVAPRTMIGLAALVYLLAIIPVIRLSDHKVPTTHFGIAASPRTLIDVQRDSSLYTALWGKFLDWIVAIKGLWLPIVFMFVTNLLPNLLEFWVSFYYDQFWDITAVDGLRIKFLSLTAALIGYTVFWKYLTVRPLWKSLFGGAILSALVSCTQIILATKSHTSLGLTATNFLLIDSPLVAFATTFAFLPTIAFAAAVVPRGIGMESTGFAVLTSAANCGVLLSSDTSFSMAAYFGIDAYVYPSQWGHFGAYIATCAAMTLIPLVMIPALRRQFAGRV